MRRRDIKTSNILLTADGVATIADVGLAKVMTNSEQLSWGHTVGTFAYAAPELLLGSFCGDKVRSLALSAGCVDCIFTSCTKPATARLRNKFLPCDPELSTVLPRSL